jgi:hypothetical protein
MRRLLIALLFFPFCSNGGEIITAEVSHHDKRYFVELEVLINAPADAVYRLLTDYNHLTRLHEMFRESQLVFSLDKHNHRVRVVSKACITYFCKEVVQVQDVEEKNNNVIIAKVLPDKSDFVYAHAFWKVIEDGYRTRLIFNTDLKPKFWVPPLIGPLLIKKKLRDSSIETVQNLEILARQPNG